MYLYQKEKEMQAIIILVCLTIILMSYKSFSMSNFFGFVQEGINLSARSFGFHSFESMISYIFVIANKLTTATVLITSITIGTFAWMEQWVFAPMYTYIVFSALTLSEALLGTAKAMLIDNEKFNWDKFLRIVPKFMAHTFALSAAFHMANAEPLFAWMPSTIFIFFGIQNFMKSILHLVDMNILDGSFANFMRERFSQNNQFQTQHNENKPSGDQDPS